MALIQASEEPTLTNVSFVNNSAASEGGAMYNYGVLGPSTPTIKNSIFWGNTAGSNPDICNFTAPRPELATAYSKMLNPQTAPMTATTSLV
ncbi:MAG: hypothetical protein R2880_11150 [Deinococcales bacterium]